MVEFRVEKDSMGEVQVPADAYYGASTQRAVDNFPISSHRFGRGFISALGLIKGSAADSVNLAAPLHDGAHLVKAQIDARQNLHRIGRACRRGDSVASRRPETAP